MQNVNFYNPQNTKIIQQATLATNEQAGGRGSLSWPECSLRRATGFTEPTWPASSAETAPEVAKAHATQLSARRGAINRSPIEIAAVWSEREQSPRCGGNDNGGRGGGRSADSVKHQAYQSMPIVERQNLSEHSTFYQRRVGRGTEETDYDDSKSTSTSSGLVSEDLDLVASSEESSGQVELPQLASNNPTDVASGSHKQSSTKSETKKRRSLAVRAGRGDEGSTAPDHDHHQRAKKLLLRMSGLKGAPHGGDASNRGKQPARALSDGCVDPAMRFSLNTRSSMPVLRSKVYHTEDRAHSMPLIFPEGAAGSGKTHVRPGGVPRKIERSLSRQGGLFRLDNVGKALGRGGHVKTLLRIRSTDRPRYYRTPLEQIPAGRGVSGSGKIGKEVVPLASSQEISPNQPSLGTVVATVGAVVADNKMKEAVDVPEEIDVHFKSGDGIVPVLLEEKCDSISLVSEDNIGHRKEINSESPVGSGDVEEWGMPSTRPDKSGIGGDDCTGGLSLELSILQEQTFGEMEQSYDFSESGTLQMHGFVLKPDGMKSTPAANSACKPVLR